MKGYIITRCFDLANRAAATLVFDTIRIGFPTLDITCFYLGDFPEVKAEVIEKCKRENIEFRAILRAETNDQVIEMLMRTATEDFVVIDSDVIFWKSVEWYKPTRLLAGRHVPTHEEGNDNSVTQERLHTSLLYFTNPAQIREEIKKAYTPLCDGRFTNFNVYAPVTVMLSGKPIFYDSCAVLYHAIGGEGFGRDVLECYDHLHFGSFHNTVLEHKPEMRPEYLGAFSHPESFKGKHKDQRIYWYRGAFKALQAKLESRLPESALTFIIGYGKYVGMIDDLIDEPANPKMVAAVTAYAAKLFSSNYWTENSAYLRVVEQLVHVIYFSSLDWEKAPEAWKRRDARVLSHCGYYLILAIFLHETKDVEATKQFAGEMLELNHAEHLEDLTQEEMLS